VISVSATCPPIAKGSVRPTNKQESGKILNRGNRDKVREREVIELILDIPVMKLAHAIQGRRRETDYLAQFTHSRSSTCLCR
jgi:hypothetical protein